MGVVDHIITQQLSIDSFESFLLLANLIMEMFFDVVMDSVIGILNVEQQIASCLQSVADCIGKILTAFLTKLFSSYKRTIQRYAILSFTWLR